MKKTSPPSRPLGLWSAAAIVAASMVGAGIFVTSGYALQALGSPERVLVAWILGGFVAIAGAISYGALSRRLTESGGEYVFLARHVHPLAGFLAGWVSLLAGFTCAMAVAATTFESYALPDGTNGHGMLAMAAIAFCAVQHAMGVEGGTRLQNVVVAFKLLGLVALAVAGAWWLSAQPTTTTSLVELQPFDWLTFGNQMTWIALSYSGFNAAIYVAEEIREPERNVPRAMLLATAGVFVLYLALNFLFVYAGPVEQLAGEGEIAAVAMNLLGGPTAALVCRMLVCVALFSSVSALAMTGPRVYAKMAADGLFPLPVAGSDGAPRLAIAVQAGMAMLVVALTPLLQQLNYLGFMLSVSAACTVASLFLSPSGVTSQRPRRWQLCVAAIFVVASFTFATLSAIREPQACALAGGLTVVSGLVAYFAMQWWNSGDQGTRRKTSR